MNKERESTELRVMAKAFSAVGFALWGVLPMLVLGALVSAVARHGNVEQELQAEPVYKFITHWMGGFNSLPPVLLLMLFFTVLFALSYWLRKSGFSEPIDGMERGRVFLRKFLIPAFLSVTAFVCGIRSQGTVKTMAASVALLMCFAFFAAMVHYFADTTEFE